MIAGMHLLGPDALVRYIASDGAADLRDPYGTPIEKYITTLSDYETPFAPDRPAI